ncbi:MAG: GGDEF domain-containing protein [Desulfobacterales bacterium]|nr:GGDEF domain-containing protein [Desulfobacterales bacterium]
MAYGLKKIFRNAATITNLVLGLAQKVDYKTLNQYIIDINQKRDLNSILQTTSKCLKDILNYRLFAFAVQRDEKLDVWIDPSMYSKPLRKIIEKDFGLSAWYNTHYIDECRSSQTKMLSFSSGDLTAYVISGDDFIAKMYILPERRILKYHIEIINIIIKTLGIALNNFMNIKRLENAASFDPLTNCYNRREFDRLIDHNIANSLRHEKNMSVIMLDIDHFKNVNDTYGHEAGDIALKNVSKNIQFAIRKSDYLARYGGEEFVVVLPDTKISKAIELAERLRAVIENNPIALPDGKELKITASFGVSSLKSSSNQQTLLREADENLYKAKASGRNAVMPGLKLCALENTAYLVGNNPIGE